VADRGATSTLTVVGELDLETADELVTVAEAALRRSHRVVIDLSQTDFVGSVGIRALLIVKDTAQTFERELVIVPGPAHVQRVFTITGMEDVLPFAKPDGAEGTAVAWDENAASDNFSVRVSGPEGARCIEIYGDLDFEARIKLLDAVFASLEGRPQELVLDLSALRSVDQTGINLFREIDSACQALECRLSLLAAPDDVQVVFRAAGAEAELPFLDVRPLVRPALTIDRIADEAADPDRFHHHIAILIADDDRRLVAANPAACELLGRSESELARMRIEDIASETLRPLVAEAWQRFLADGHQSGEYDVVRASGETVRVTFSATASIYPGRHLSVLTRLPAGVAEVDFASGAD
jgi:anti-anti-sigma factor